MKNIFKFIDKEVAHNQSKMSMKKLMVVVILHYISGK